MVKNETSFHIMSCGSRQKGFYKCSGERHLLSENLRVKLFKCTALFINTHTPVQKFH